MPGTTRATPSISEHTQGCTQRCLRGCVEPKIKFRFCMHPKRYLPNPSSSVSDAGSFQCTMAWSHFRPGDSPSWGLSCILGAASLYLAFTRDQMPVGVMRNRTVSRHCQMSGGTISLLIKNHWQNAMKFSNNHRNTSIETKITMLQNLWTADLTAMQQQLIHLPTQTQNWI